MQIYSAEQDDHALSMGLLLRADGGVKCLAETHLENVTGLHRHGAWWSKVQIAQHSEGHRKVIGISAGTGWIHK